MDMITLAMAKAHTNRQRLGYVESEAVVYFPEYNVACTAVIPSAIVPSFRGFANDANVLYTGEKVTVVVTFDGVQYERTMKIEYASRGYWSVGNNALRLSAGGKDTGEPFLIYVTNSIEVYATTSGTHTVKVEIPEQVKTIDPKYIPGAVLPVVELTTTPVSGGAALTAEESVKMDALNGEPCIIKFAIQDDSMGTVYYALVFSSVSDGNSIYIYSAITSYGNFQVTNGSGSWTISPVG